MSTLFEKRDVSRDQGHEQSLFNDKRYLESIKTKVEAQRLPIREKMAGLKQAIAMADSAKLPLLLQGETGSGKSIFTPLALVEYLREHNLPSTVAVVSPTRVSTAGSAYANAAIGNQVYGSERGVGVLTADLKVIDEKNNVRFMTAGIFLREMVNGSFDRNNIGAIMIDELHCGTLQYHAIMGLLKIMLNNDFAPLAVLTSATIEKEKIMDF